MNYKDFDNNLTILDNELFVSLRGIQYGFDKCEGDRDKSMKMHYNEYSMHYVYSGCGYISYDGGKPLKVTKGQIFMLLPTHDIVYYPDKRRPYTYAWINFNGSNVDSLLRSLSLSSTQPILDLNNYKQIGNLFLENIQACKANPQFADWTSTSYLYKIIALLLQEKAAVGEKKRVLSHIELAQMYIEDNYHNSELNLRAVADHLSLNPAYFSRLFKQQLGVSFSSYLQSLRIRKSVFLINNGETSVKILAESCGFSSQYYFSTIFKHLHSISPQQYVRQLQERKRREKEKNPETL